MLAERLSGVRGDVQELSEEQKRTRDRLHKLEGLVGMLVDDQRRRKSEAEQRQNEIKLRLAVLTVAVSIAAVAVPIIVAVLATR